MKFQEKRTSFGSAKSTSRDSIKESLSRGELVNINLAFNSSDNKAALAYNEKVSDAKHTVHNLSKANGKIRMTQESN